jgi:hypothetical protein
MLLKRLEYIKQTKNETVKEFQDRFENLLYHIPRSHHPGDKYLVYLNTLSLGGLRPKVHQALTNKNPRCRHIQSSV